MRCIRRSATGFVLHWLLLLEWSWDTKKPLAFKHEPSLDQRCGAQVADSNGPWVGDGILNLKHLVLD
jgi:hypothetical protein